MHRVLRVPEVLLKIFCQLLPSGPISKEAREDVNCDLVALARTCRAFKEPALDMLWSELNDPSPIIRCLPEISQTYQIPAICRIKPRERLIKGYTFTRPLERTEWNILRNYTRRVRCLRSLDGPEINWEFVTRTFAALTPAEPLFPNLRSLHCMLMEDNIPLFQLHFPSLILLDFHFSMVPLIILEPLKPLVNLASPSIKRLGIFCENWVSTHERKYMGILSDDIRRRSNLQSVTCPQIPLDLDTLVYLSRVPSLAQFTFALSDTLLDSSAPSYSLFFPALKEIKLHATSLALISRFLSWTRLPAITNFSVIIDMCPSKQDLVSFMACIQDVGMGQTIQKFILNQVHIRPELVRSRNLLVPQLDSDDLRSCVAFPRLIHVNLDLEWDVILSGDELLMLGLAWPQIEELLINTNWGWNRLGITPNELAVLLEACPSLTSVALAINTRGYTQMPAEHFRGPISASSFERTFRLNVLDSDIERRSMGAMVALFASIVPHFDFILTARETWPDLHDNDVIVYRERWKTVHSQANETIKKRWSNALCRFLFPS